MNITSRDTVDSSAGFSRAAHKTMEIDQTIHRVGGQVKGVADAAMDAVTGGVSSAATAASDLASGAAAAASKLTGNVADTLREGAEAQKNAGADVVTGLARSAREAAGRIEETSPQIAGLVRQSADTVERVSTSIRSQTLGELLESTSAFAAKQPAAFFGVGILAGLVLSRLLRDNGAR